MAGERIGILASSPVKLRDNVPLRFGDGAQWDNRAVDDVHIKWDGSVLEVLPTADDTGAFNIGDGTTDLDLKVFLGTASAYVLFDVGAASLVISAGVILSVDDVTDTTSAVTGSIHTDGGLGIAKALWVGTTARLVGLATLDAGLRVDDVTDTTSAITGSIQTDGGLGIAKALWVGTTARLVGVATFDAQDIHSAGLTVANAKPIVQGMNTFPKLTVTVKTSGAGYNMTAAELLSGCISDTSATGAIAATLPSVADVVALIPGYVAGTAFYLDMRNPGTQTITLTVDGGGQWTLVGTMTIATLTHKRFLCVINSATTGTIYSVGASTA